MVRLCICCHFHMMDLDFVLETVKDKLNLLHITPFFLINVASITLQVVNCSSTHGNIQFPCSYFYSPVFKFSRNLLNPRISPFTLWGFSL